ncbi:MAG: glycosyltransferase [Gammaproteobacteria bacterium]|nr:glycosyltransferase [Gammaproteobacteria bacterium]
MIRVLALSCLFPNAEQPGYGIFVLHRLRAVSRRCAVRVVAPIAVYPLFDRALRGLRHGGHVGRSERWGGMQVDHPRFTVIPRFLKGFDALSCAIATVRRVRAIEREEGFRADVIDVHWTYPDVVAGYWLARTRARKLLVTVRGREALYPGEHGLRRLLLAYCLRRADGIVTLSDELRTLVADLGVPRHRLRTILNGVDAQSFAWADPAACRARLGIAPGKRILLSVGALVMRKGHHKLVQAVRSLGRAAALELYIAGGPGPEEDAAGLLHRMIADGALANVHLLGSLEQRELRFWYGAADLFCLATEGEGCPNVVLEALACGAPVVATDVGAIRELIVEGENGFVVGTNDAGPLAAAIARALEWPWDRKRIARTMRRRGWDRCASEVVAAYRAVLGAQIPPSIEGCSHGR